MSRQQARKSRTRTAIEIAAALTLCLALLASFVACGQDSGQSQQTKATASSRTTQKSDASTAPPSTGSPDSSSSLSNPWKERSYLPSQPVDIASIVNLAQANLGDKEKQVLARQSFVAVACDPATATMFGYMPWKFWQIYEGARYQGLPAFVTTDSFLNAYHGLFDTLLQRLEEGALFQQALTLSQNLYESASEQWNEATDPAVKEDARLNMAYFAVAVSLLQGAVAAPEVVRDQVEAELELIESASEVVDSPILDYLEDYTQYKPRGHYTRSETLKRYFKALMWYGHTAFFINEREPDITPPEALSLTRRAVLAASALTGPAKQAWLAIYEPTSFLVGRADDLTPSEVTSVVAQVYGVAEPPLDQLADKSKIEQLRAELNKLRAPQILSAARPAPGTGEERQQNERSFRIMGQRFIPDSYAFQQLVWPYVGAEDDLHAGKRDLPMGLDAMIVLGSDQAYRIATEDFGQDQYARYEQQLKKVYDQFASRDPDLWPVNLYTGWLEALQKVMAPPAEGVPDFMKTRVWARKSLNAALGSWTELRHDTILYAKQSVTAEGDGGEADVPPGYVEPYPEFFAKMGELASTLRSTLLQYDLLDPVSANKLETMIWLAEILGSAAQKELAGEMLTAEEESVIAEYGHYLEYLEQFEDTSGSSNSEGRTLSPTPEKSPVVADVHSSYNSGLVLEEGTGYPLVLYAAFERGGKTWLFVGASYSYYEFTVPLDQRLTDEEWVELLDSGQAPPRPLWTDEWIVRCAEQ